MLNRWMDLESDLSLPCICARINVEQRADYDADLLMAFQRSPSHSQTGRWCGRAQTCCYGVCPGLVRRSKSGGWAGPGACMGNT